MNRVSKRLVLYLVLIVAFIASPFVILNGNSGLNRVQIENNQIEEDENDNDNVIVNIEKPVTTLEVGNAKVENKEVDLVVKNASNYLQLKCKEDKSSYTRDGIRIYTIRVIFYKNEKSFSNGEVSKRVEMLSAVNPNDDIYSVAEYFSDITFGRLKLVFSFATKDYDESCINYENSEYDVTINWYNANGLDRDSVFHPHCIMLGGYMTNSKDNPTIQYIACGGIIVLDSSSDIPVVCHELIHTFNVKDLYSNEMSARLGESFVGGWDIICENFYKNPQFPTVETMSYVSNLTQSQYFDNQKSNIEILNTSATVNLKATSYATEKDTIAIKINATDLGYTGNEAEKIYFMVEYRKPNGIKDKYNPYNDESIIVYRVNKTIISNLKADCQEKTRMFVFRKNNSASAEMAGLVLGDIFGSNANRSYNTIFMPSGENTGIVISNIKFGEDGNCSFSIDLTKNEKIIYTVGKLLDNDNAVGGCDILLGGQKLGTTNAQGEFCVSFASAGKLVFIKNGVVLKSVNINNSQKDLVFYVDDNSCNIIIKNDVSSVTVRINDGDAITYGTNFDLKLKSGDKVEIISSGYEKYLYEYQGELIKEITLNEESGPNILEQTIDNIAENFGKAQKVLDDVINGLFNLF